MGTSCPSNGRRQIVDTIIIARMDGRFADSRSTFRDSVGMTHFIAAMIRTRTTIGDRIDSILRAIGIRLSQMEVIVILMSLEAPTGVVSMPPTVAYR